MVSASLNPDNLPPANNTSYMCCLCNPAQTNMYDDELSFLSHLTLHHRVCRFFDTLLQFSSVQHLSGKPSSSSADCATTQAPYSDNQNATCQSQDTHCTEAAPPLAICADDDGMKTETGETFPDTAFTAYSSQIREAIRDKMMSCETTTAISSFFDTSAELYPYDNVSSPLPALLPTSGEQQSAEVPPAIRSGTDSHSVHSHQNTSLFVKRQHRCVICYKVLATRSTLIHHMRIHTGERPYRCVTCSKDFRQRTSLKRHMKTHSGEKPHRCPICDRGFLEKFNLQSHMRGHATNHHDIHRCPLCERTFTYRATLQNHMRTHSVGNTG